VSHLPVIVSIGGANSAGRSSFHHGYRRLVIDRLEQKERQDTLLSLATMMGLLKSKNDSLVDMQGRVCLPEEVEARFATQIYENTLLRKIIPDLFDVDRVPMNRKIEATDTGSSDIRFSIPKKQLPNPIPTNWQVSETSKDPDQVEVAVNGSLEFYLRDFKESLVKTAGQLPTGFDAGRYYSSTHHPRGLQMAVFGASDLLNALGIDWETVKQSVHPDQIGVYAGSGHGQMDDTGGGGLMKALLEGKRTSSRYLPLSLVDMPSNFINAYVIGNIGHTGTQIAACATFLYNLDLAIKEIQLGKRRVAIVGNSEAPILPEIIDGYKAMGALADDARLLNFSKNGIISHADRAASCKPFSENCGFTLSESSQFLVLFDDELALELGAQIYGSVADIFIKADGYKKSISSPGFGNYITLAKASARLRAILGEDSLRNRSYVSSHGSGTPLNRTTESHGLNETAKAFKINQWLISAVKCYLGHPLTPASGDQLITALGTWQYGWVPGIFTLDAIPEDVHRSNLKFSKEHVQVEKDAFDAVFINSKGFGGNNATGLVLSPQVTLRMLEHKHGKSAITAYQERCQKTMETAQEYDKKAIKGEFEVYYKDGEHVLNEQDLELTDKELKIPGYKKSVDLNLTNSFPDMTPV